MKPFRIVTSLNIAALGVLLLVVWESSSAPSLPLTDYGAPLGLIALFLLIPTGGWYCWRWLRIHKSDAPGPSTYLTLSGFFLFLMWLMSCYPVVYYGGLYLHSLPEPWLESNQGPDTPPARSGLEKLLGPDLAAKTQAAYYRFEPDQTLARFDLAAGVSIETLARHLSLSPQPHCLLNLADPPSWWTPGTKGACYSDARDPSAFAPRQLWLEAEAGHAYFKRFEP